MNKIILGSILFIILAVGGMALLLRGSGTTPLPVSTGSSTNVAVTDGKQLVQINAKGGYAPRVSAARANMPTVINVKTNGTFDCSSALSIPALGIRKMLPSSGVTSIEVPPQPPGTTIKGVCSMGMYNFAVNFN